VKSIALLLNEWWEQVFLFIITNFSHAHLTSTLKMGAACSSKILFTRRKCCEKYMSPLLNLKVSILAVGLYLKI